MNLAARADTVAEGSSVVCPEYPAGTATLLDVLRYQSEHIPHRIVCNRVARQRTGIVSTALTVGELSARSAQAAATLRAKGIRPGDRVILSLSDPHDFLVAFFGTLLAEASAVPLPTLAESGAPRSFAARVRAVCADCAPSLAVVEGSERFAHTLGAMPPGLALIEPAELIDDRYPVAGSRLAEPDTEHRLPATPEAPAFIQYTSGSTGTPKGVVVTHANIIENCRAIRDATAYTRADRMVSWLPLHHDMGLVGGLLTSIYCAAETCLMPPMAFLARPVSWLEAMTHCGATLTVAPTFAYSLCARKIPEKQLENIDLSSLRLAYIGAEPVDVATVDAFTERFAPYGLSPNAIYPVYGLAEATLAVSFPEPGSPVRRDAVDRRRLAADGVAAPAEPNHPEAATFISVGRALPRHRVQIVDRASGAPLGERRVGEVIFEGGSVTPRYFGEAGARTRLHTGDLAYVADGDLYVVDRINDLVIVAGQNYAPSDIENAVADIAGLRRGRVVAFSMPGNAGTEQLYVVAELSPDSWRDPQALAEEVRRRVREEIGLAASSVTIVAPGTLERTSSGKIKRRACAAAHRDGKLAALRTRADVVSIQLRRRGHLLRHHAGRAVRAVLSRAGIGSRPQNS
jgi:acyl-CoA synthetase (AMP-forming)/AMP-acid ligase II